LIEWRARADDKENPKLLRISVGVEEIQVRRIPFDDQGLHANIPALQDLIDDMREGLKAVAQ
jgi:hypothetical protein